MNNSNFHVLELSAYQTPEIYEDPREDYVSYGEDNNLYQDLIDAFLNSPTTGSIITGVSNQIYGKGFSALDSNRKPDEYAQFIGLFKAKDLKKICLDLKLLGEAAFQITYKGKRVDSVSQRNLRQFFLLNVALQNYHSLEVDDRKYYINPQNDTIFPSWSPHV